MRIIHMMKTSGTMSNCANFGTILFVIGQFFMWVMSGIPSPAQAQEPGQLARSMVGGPEIERAYPEQKDRFDLIKRVRVFDYYKHEASAEEFNREVTCLTRNIYFEARGESYDGWRGVAHVTLNRVISDRYPDSICGVVRQKNERGRCQFSWYCDGLRDIVGDDPKEASRFIEIAKLAERMMTEFEWDIANGALHYYNAAKANPRWAWGQTPCAKIGSHIFLCGVS